MLRDLTAMGASGIFLHPEGTELKLHEASQKSGSAQLYETLLDYCDNAESKALLGNTLTTQTDDTGTQALGTVHKNAEEAINHMDRLYVLNVLNYDMTEIFAAMGIDVAGGRFEYEQPKNIDLTARIGIDRTLTGHGVAHRRRLSLRNLRRGTPGRLCRDEGTNVAKPRHGSHRGCRSISAKPHDTGILEPHARFFRLRPRPRCGGFRMVMESLYGNAAAKTAESFDSTVLMRMLRDIYEKKFDPRTEINREMFEEVWDEFNRAVTDGYGKPCPCGTGIRLLPGTAPQQCRVLCFQGAPHAERYGSATARCRRKAEIIRDVASGHRTDRPTIK